MGGLDSSNPMLQVATVDDFGMPRTSGFLVLLKLRILRLRIRYLSVWLYRWDLEAQN
jgi:hypothetical protein